MARLVCVELDDETCELLEQLCGDDWTYSAQDLTGLLAWFAQCAADGIRRPGSWERGWLVQATGWSAGS